MGCICSKGRAQDDGRITDNDKVKELEKPAIQLITPAHFKRHDISKDHGRKDGSARPVSRASAGDKNGESNEEDDDVKQGKSHHQRWATMELGSSKEQHNNIIRVTSMPHGARGELIVSGWPQWLTSAAGDAIKGWLPRRADSYEKLDKIGQGTYSSVYRARDLETKRIVAMKKVRFQNMDPESVRFMAREIQILRKLDHPNVMKLEAIVTSRLSASLYLVFEYMEHDLAGLAAIPGVKFTEPQIKCYMKQLLSGLQHCHSRGILHRDIKASNLLIDDNGVLKIGDFGLANFYHPDEKLVLTSRVVTLWYRAPELLLGATEYGVAVDMWSAGCILAELFAGKPIMPGRTEVEQMHKIFKLCGSQSEDYWKKTKLSEATSFKPQVSYERRVVETFKNFPSSALALVDRLLSLEPEARGTSTSALESEFFKTPPLPCDPSSLPKHPPSKELDAKLRQEEARKRRAEAVKGRGPESVRRGKGTVSTPEFRASGKPKNATSYKYDTQEEVGSGFRIEPPTGTKQNGLSQSSSMIHTGAVGSSASKNTISARDNAEMWTQRPHVRSGIGGPTSSSQKKDDRSYSRDSSTVGFQGYVQRRNRIHCSGPLMPPGGNMEDMLKEHERQIQQAVRKARLEKSATKENLYVYSQSNYARR